MGKIKNLTFATVNDKKKLICSGTTTKILQKTTDFEKKVTHKKTPKRLYSSPALCSAIITSKTGDKNN